jgi:hypothetical protein
VEGVEDGAALGAGVEAEALAGVSRGFRWRWRGFGVGCGGLLCGIGSGIGGGFGRSAAWRVVVHIPAGALEVERWSRERALQQAVALGALQIFRVGKVLDFFKTVAALGAAISVQRQSSLPFREK